MAHAGREEFVPFRRSSSKAVCCVCMSPVPSSVTPRFEVSETLFFLLVVKGGCSECGGLLWGVAKACACQKQGHKQHCWLCLSISSFKGKEVFHCELFILLPPPAAPQEYNL